MKIFARNFRGFRKVEVDLDKLTILVGDNSSGKSSLLYLVDAIAKSDLRFAPRLDDELGVGRYDYFSPYFDEADVTFGFVRENDGDKFGKAVTLRKVEDSVPNVVRCTYWKDKRTISIRKNRATYEFFDKVRAEDLSVANILKAHEDIKGFSEIEFDSNANIADPISLLKIVEAKQKGNDDFFQAAFVNRVRSCRLISPVRAMPERFYPFKRKFDHRGSHFAAMWIDTFDENSDIFGFINRFGEEARLFDSLSVAQTTTEVSEPPLIVLVGKNGQKFTLDQVGVGISQVAPILVDMAYAIEVDAEFLLVQQPELHLHPKAQAAFGSFMLNAGNLGFRGIFETHSKFLIDRFRSDLKSSFKKGVRKKKVSDNSQAQLIFCKNSTNGNKAEIIPIKYDGSFGAPVDSFLEFFIDEYIRTL